METLTPHGDVAPAANRITVTALTALAPAVWGTTYVVTTELLPTGYPLFAGLMRSLPAGILALLISRAMPRGSWWWKAAVLGTLNIGIFFPLLFLAAERLPGGVAATIQAAQPVVVTLLAVGVLRERLSGWRLGASIVGVIGVAMVVLGPERALDPMGVLAALAAMTSMALGVILTKRWGRPDGVSAIGLAGWQLTWGGLVLVPPTLLYGGVPQQIDGHAIVGYLWLGLIGGLVAYSLWFAGIRRLRVTATAMLGLLAPVVATSLGILITGESFLPIQAIGLVIALGAMVAGQLNPLSSRRAENDAPAARR